MVLWLSMRWWYGDGWRWATRRALVQRLQWCNETFSMAGLVRTLFAPFKQTYNHGGGSIDIRIHAFIDNIVSRAVGFVSRFCILLAGLAACIFVLLTGFGFIILWPLAPLSLPISVGLLFGGVGR